MDVEEPDPPKVARLASSDDPEQKKLIDRMKQRALFDRKGGDSTRLSPTTGLVNRTTVGGS